MVTPAINSDINTSTDYLDLQIKGKNIAKALAIDLNSNEEHRKEVFTRIANKFDGDYNILVSHLSDETIKEIEQRIKTTANKKSGLNISSSDNYIKQALREEPKLQLMMPFAEGWTDEKINQFHQGGQAVGLIVAYYPFGVDDKKVKEIIGYDRNGNEIKITKQSAPTIPYIILTINERTDEDGYLKFNQEKKQKSIYGIDPKEIAINNNQTDWKRTTINSLRNKNLNPAINVVPEDDGGGGGGGGGGTPLTPPTPEYCLHVGEVKTGNISYIEFWLESEAEVYIKVGQRYWEYDYNQEVYKWSDNYSFLFLKTPAKDYDLDGGYWLIFDTNTAWDKRNKRYDDGTFIDEFKLSVMDEDLFDITDDEIAWGIFNKNPFIVT